MILQAHNLQSGLKLRAPIDARQSVFQAVRNYLNYYWPNMTERVLLAHTRDVVLSLAQHNEYVLEMALYKVKFTWEF